MATSITGAELRRCLSEHINPGDELFVHASLGNLGKFDDGVEDIIDAFLEAQGRDGTLIMMTHTFSFAETGVFTLDLPSEAGLLSETLRLRADARRSKVPMVSFAAIGRNAEEYTQTYDSHLDESAALSRLIANRGKIMLFGVPFKKCTLYHLTEERLEAPYNMYKLFDGVYRGADGEEHNIQQNYFVRKDLTQVKDARRAGEIFEKNGEVTTTALGDGVVKSFGAFEFDQTCMTEMQRDPEIFLEQRTA